jgi:hypothetical protein
MKNYREQIGLIIGDPELDNTETIESLLALCTDIAEDLSELKKQRGEVGPKKCDMQCGDCLEPQSPLQLAEEIIYNRDKGSRDKDYGGFSESMLKTAHFASLLCNKPITGEDAFKVLMALKLARISNSNKLDSYTDLIGYTEGLWNFLDGR